jgi:AraC-like DNA-binding protein
VVTHPASFNATRHLRPLIELAREAGADVELVLAGAGLSEARLLDENPRIPFEQTLALIQRLGAFVNDAALGLRLAERFELRDFDVLGYLMSSCQNALAAVQAFASHSRLICDSLHCSVNVRDKRVCVAIALSGGRPLLPEVADAFTATLHRVCCELAGATLAPVRVELPRPRPPRSEAYRRFFNAAVRFEKERCLLVYPERALVASRAAGDARLSAILARQAALSLSELPVLGGLVERVRADIRAQLVHCDIALEVTAARLAMGERTLRRHLHRAGCSYRMLCDEVRREHALRLTRDGRLNVTAIAQSVGFADASAFARAFKRWTGMAPREYVRRWRQAPALNRGRKSRIF